MSVVRIKPSRRTPHRPRVHRPQVVSRYLISRPHLGFRQTVMEQNSKLACLAVRQTGMRG